MMLSNVYQWQTNGVMLLELVRPQQNRSVPSASLYENAPNLVPHGQAFQQH